MILFNSDYTEGAHPAVFQKLTETNLEQTNGYGVDPYCDKAKELIKAHIKRECDIHFLVGGTQANLTLISAALRPYEGVISASTGHINVHETGAIEYTGHKVLSIDSPDGKLTARMIQDVCKAHFEDCDREHTVKPGMVYISNPTEIGTIYSLGELMAIREVCDRFGMYLFMDGARLGYGLASPENDLTLESIAENCDAFYIGGTKVGALFGEAIVIVNENLKKDFRYSIKQKGALLAKGRLLGLQFAALFEDDLYFKISEHAVLLAMKLKEALTGMGVRFLCDSPTNQLFPIFEDRFLEKLKDKYGYSYIQRMDEKCSCVRFCTSWATKEEDVSSLIKDIYEILTD